MAEQNTSIQSPEEFRLIAVTLSSDRFPATIDLKNLTVEFNIFENINIPYLTGSLIILDDNKIYDTLQIQGTERIQIVVSLGATTDQIEKNFVITQVASTTKVNDYSAIIRFDLIEDIGYLNNIQKFSKMYDGKGERIIHKIIEDRIFKSIANIDTPIAYQTFVESYQALFRLLVPYITPFNAVKLVLDKMTTDKGLPYYLYSTLVDDNLFLADLETILLRQPFNDRPFVFSQSQTNSRTDNPTDIVQQSYSILNVYQPNVDDTMLLSEMGAINSTYSNIDVSTGEVNTYSNIITDVIDRLKTAGIIDESDIAPIDDKFVPDRSGENTAKLLEYNSRHFDEISGSTNPYDDGINNWTLESQDEYFLRIQKFAIKQLMMRNTQVITVPGFWFLTKNPQTSVGNQININIFKNDPNVTNSAAATEVIDSKRSGDYVMVAKRHLFNVTEYRHICTIECARLTHPQV